MQGDPQRDPPWLTLYPSWIYTETKRSEGVQWVWRRWEWERQSADRGSAFRLRVWDKGEWFLFLSATVWRDFTASYAPHWSDEGVVRLPKASAIRTLWLDSDRKAYEESRRVAVVAQRVHGQRGIYLYLKESDWPTVHDLLKKVREVEQEHGGIKEWRRKNPKPKPRRLPA